MKKALFFILALIIIVTAGCTTQGEDIQEEKIKPVKIQEIKEEKRKVYLNYIGVIDSEEMKKIGFKSSGKLESVYVKNGEEVKKGMEIARLDTTDLEFGVLAAKAQMEGAKAQYDKALNGATSEDIKKAELNMKKAKDSYTYTKENYEKLVKLYKEGAISKDNLDKGKLELDIRESEYNQAQEMYNQVKNGAREEDQRAARAVWEQAKADYEYKENSLKESTIVSDIDGYIVDTLYEVGELIPQGHPVVIIRNDNKVINIGLSQKDVYKVSVGNEVRVNLDNISAKGKISNISNTPHQGTRTYEAEVILEENNFKIGTIVKAQIITGEEKGIWIPITAIMTAEEDYVYISQEGVVRKQKVDLGDIDGSRVRVYGLLDGDKLIVENIKEISPGDLVMEVDRKEKEEVE